MNLTRRILEGIHEVELEINPEFQKDPKRQIDILEKKLQATGWKVTSHKHKGNSKYEVDIEFAHPGTDEILKIVYSLEDSSIVSAMLMAPGHQSNILTQTVPNILAFAKASIAGDVGKKLHSTSSGMVTASDVSVGALQIVLDELGWQAIKFDNSQKNTTSVTFEHPEIEGIELEFMYMDEDSMLAHTFAVHGPWPEGGALPMETDLNRIKKITKGWVTGMNPTSDEPPYKDTTVDKDGMSVGIGDYRGDLEETGWTYDNPVKATINLEGKSRMGFSMDFKHPSTKDTLRLFYLDDGTVVRVFILSDPVGSVSIHPTIGSVIDAAAGLVAQP